MVPAVVQAVASAVPAQRWRQEDIYARLAEHFPRYRTKRMKAIFDPRSRANISPFSVTGFSWG